MLSVTQAPSVKVVDIFSFVKGVQAYEENIHHGTYYNLNPKHQRHVIHDDLWKCSIITSLFTFKDIPAVYFHDTTDPISGSKVYESLDGKQRCAAIYEYCSNQFTFQHKGNQILPIEMEGMVGKYFNELSVKQVNYINSFELVIRYYNFTFTPKQIEAFFRLHQEQKATSSGEFLNSGSSQLRDQISELLDDIDVKYAVSSYIRNNRRCAQLTSVAYIAHMFTCRDDDRYIDLRNDQLYKWWAQTKKFEPEEIRFIKEHIIRISEFMDDVQMGFRFSKGNYCGVSWFLLKNRSPMIDSFTKHYYIRGFSFPSKFTLGCIQCTMPRYEYMVEMYIENIMA